MELGLYRFAETPPGSKTVAQRLRDLLEVRGIAYGTSRTQVSSVEIPGSV